MSRQNGIMSETRLLVEGKDEVNFFEALLGHLGVDTVHIQSFDGALNLSPFLDGIVREPAFRAVRRIGIVRDADKSAQSAFDSVLSSLRQADLPQPARLGARSGGRPEVSVFVMPGNGRPGMLETILHDTFRGTPIDDCIDGYFECVGGLLGADLRRPDKARVHAWLATRPDPHVSAGVAAKKGYWDMDHPALKGVREFLLALRDGAGGP